MSQLIQVFQDERKDLVRFAKSFGIEDAEDAVQDAIIYAIEKSYDTKYDDKGPLSLVAYARVLVYWRVRAKQADDIRRNALIVEGYDEENEDGETGPSYNMDQVEAVIDVQNALAELPLHEKVIAQGVLIHGETLDKMADIMGKSKGWAYNTLESARLKLSKSLASYGPGKRSDYLRAENCSSSRRA